ncbi:MAG: threonine--tRNA ligase, partial [Acidiferrobacteraceae bacterium]|nr:threonine--tRNA ligase [Acidiferrobacteraceae bacterium]
MPTITLPDGSVRRFDHAVTVAEVAADIGPGLAKAALGGEVDGQLVDTACYLEQDARLRILTDKDAEGLELIRHSCAHLMAQAVKELYPQAQVTIGPAIEDGFYYDFAYDPGFTEADLALIQARMEELARADLPVVRQTMARDDAIEMFKAKGEEYKAEIIGEVPVGESISLYSQGEFTDLCRGPHVPSTGRVKAFQLTKLAGAYWRGDPSQQMLQRIYGTAWAKKEDLQDYLHRLTQAEKRDHRKLGREL